MNNVSFHQKVEGIIIIFGEPQLKPYIMAFTNIPTISLIFFGSTLLSSIFASFSEENYIINNGNNSSHFLPISRDWYEAYLERDQSSPKVEQERVPPSRKFLLLPAGTELDLNPTLRIPIIDKNSFGIGSGLHISLPFTVAFDKLFLKDLDLFPEDYVDNGHLVLWPWRKSSTSTIQARMKRSTTKFNKTKEATTLCDKLASQKLAIFKKLESFMNAAIITNKSPSLRAEDCVLRTICEIFKYPVNEGFGVMGDLIRELVRVDKINIDECGGKMKKGLKKYLEAQQSGVKGSCVKFTKKCSKSLFMS